LSPPEAGRIGIERSIDMPKQKDLKRLARTRMKKTGESYTAARAQLVRKKTSRSRPADTRQYAELARMSDEAVHAKTGKTWAQWVAALDAIDAQAMPHRDIARHVHETYGIGGWWSQTVTVGYERIRGLRDVGQRRSGEYEANKSRTFPVPVETLYRAFANPRVRSKWLADFTPRVSKASPSKSVRMVWPDGTRVEVYFVAKGGKSQAAVQHRKLPSKAEVARVRAWWAERLEALAETLAG
jgi:hypothetical protein